LKPISAEDTGMAIIGGRRPGSSKVIRSGTCDVVLFCRIEPANVVALVIELIRSDTRVELAKIFDTANG